MHCILPAFLWGAATGLQSKQCPLFGPSQAQVLHFKAWYSMHGFRAQSESRALRCDRMPGQQ